MQEKFMCRLIYLKCDCKNSLYVKIKGKIIYYFNIMFISC